MGDMQSGERYTIGRPQFGKALAQWRFTFRYVIRDKTGEPRFLLQAAIPLEREGTFLHRMPLPLPDEEPANTATPPIVPVVGAPVAPSLGEAVKH